MAEKKRLALGLAGKDLFVLFGYVAMLCFALPRYQPWDDEGRAWLDARYFSLFHLVFHVLRYERHPAIWYLLLWLLSHVHMPFIYLNCVAATIAVAGIYVLLRCSPFPFYLRAVLPFGFALAWQYAIVARDYVLFPLFGFLIAHEYRQITRRPLRMAIYLALLANLTVHGTLVALVFGASYAWALLKEHRREKSVSWSIPEARRAAFVFAGSLLFVVVTVWPPDYLTSPAAQKLVHLFGRSSHATLTAPSRQAHPILLQVSNPAQPDPVPTATPHAIDLGVATLGLTVPERFAIVFFYPVATFAPLALLFEILVFALVWRRRAPILLFAPLLLGAFLIAIYVKLWHVYLIWVVLLMLLWAVWDPNETVALSRPTVTLQNAIAALLFLICLLQLPWTFNVLRFERTHSTYPAPAAAEYLRSLPPHQRVDGFDAAGSILPYFPLDHYPFHLQADSLDVPTVLADKPDVILLQVTSLTGQQMSQLTAAGYRPTRTFCGSLFFPNQPLFPVCLTFLERSGRRE